MGSTSSVSMLPRPSRLKSLDSELSPVLTTPPPVEPNTVLVLMSVPEIMLSSNLVAVRRRAANNPAISAMMPSTPAMIAHMGVLLSRSSKNDAAGFEGALAFVAGALVSGALASAFGSGAFASAGFASALASGAFASGAFASGALASGAFASGGFACGTGAGGVTAAGAAGAALGAGATAGACAICVGGVFAASAVLALLASACF